VASQPASDWFVAAMAEPPPPATAPTAIRLVAAIEMAAFFTMRINSPLFRSNCALVWGFPGDSIEHKHSAFKD
jgi:hypothetical protein